jgi:Tol biopolymer transport system component
VCRSLVKILALRYMVLVPLLLGLALLASCDGSNNSSSPATEAEPTPPSGKMDVLVFQAYCCSGDAYEDRNVRLYKTNRLGESTLLSNTTAGESVIDYAVAPDSERLAYWYSLEGGESALAILNLDPVAREQPAPVVTGQYTWTIDWRPDSQSLVYSAFEGGSLASSLFLAYVGDQSPHEIISAAGLGAQAAIDYRLSSDGNHLAMSINTNGENQQALTSLYLTDLAAPQVLTLIDTGSGEANRFNFSWSPYANELAYQPRFQIIDPPFGLGKTNFAQGPVSLVDSSGVSRPVFEQNDDIPYPYTPYTWLDEQRILLIGYDQFVIIATDGTLLAQQGLSTGSGVVLSPDKQRLAYISRAPGSPDHEVFVMEVATGHSQSVGPASAIFEIRNLFDVSSLRWSQDGSMLAWNRRISYQQSDVGELYVHDFNDSRTHLLTSGYLHRNGLSYFSWLAGEKLIEYVESTGNGLELALTDPLSQTTQWVGVMSPGPDTSCSYARAWRSKAEVVWNHCDDGVYLSLIKANGAVTDTRLLDGNIYSYTLKLTRNGELAVMQSDGPTNNWYLYDFWESQLMALQGTEGESPVSVTLLQ